MKLSALLALISVALPHSGGASDAGPARKEHFLVLHHPFYGGSHLLTLHVVSAELVSRGHRVTTVRFADLRNITLEPLGPRHQGRERERKKMPFI